MVADPPEIPDYVGRFAPSPTGPLHLGSLVAALGSWLDARHHGGRWLLRVEDIDPPREVPGAADAILRALERLGLEWDGEVLYQGGRGTGYAAALDELIRLGVAYPCACSRRAIAALATAGPEGPVYPGTCRRGLPTGARARAWRIDTSGAEIAFEDGVRGAQVIDLERELGDFVLRRADGLWAYHLAVVVDDAFQGVTQVVRGADLLLSTARHLQLQWRLGLPEPAYTHLPLVLGRDGAKLSKQTGARALDLDRPVRTLIDALRFLGQAIPEGAEDAEPHALLIEAARRWDRTRIPRQPDRGRGSAHEPAAGRPG